MEPQGVIQHNVASLCCNSENTTAPVASWWLSGVAAGLKWPFADACPGDVSAVGDVGCLLQSINKSIISHFQAHIKQNRHGKYFSH